MKTRKCYVCKKIKPLEEFSKDKAQVLGRKYLCSPCNNLTKRLSIRKITKQFYTDLLTIQENKCQICKQEFFHTPYIDHCHTTGQVRGLLCRNCNTGLGYFKDNTEFLTSAIEYLKANDPKD